MIRAFGLTFLGLTIGLTLSGAAVIQGTVVLPPASGGYILGGICVSALNRCTENALVSDFSVITNTQNGGDQLVVASATYSADVFSDSSGVPGAFLGHLSFLGTVDVTFEDRDPSVNPLGTFTTNLTDFDFLGTLNGNTFEVRQDPGKPSTGSTTILEVTFVPPIKYSVSGFLNIFAQYSFNGGPFTSAPPRSSNLDSVPEPGLSLLVGLILAGVLAITARRRRLQ